MKYAGLRKRIWAYFLDVIPITIIIFGVAYFFLGFDKILSAYMHNPKDIESRMSYLIARNIIRDSSLFVWVFYGLVMDCSRFQGTLGKKILGIKVVDKQGDRITFGKSIIRAVMKIVGAIPLFLGYFWAVFRKDNAAWHDLVAKTCVCENNLNLINDI